MRTSAELLVLAESAQVFKFTYACKAALFVYDFLITFGDEVEFIWPSGWGFAQLLYYSARYSAWPEACVELIFYFGNLSEDACRYAAIYQSLSLASGMILGQSIILLRTWAIWNGAWVAKLGFLAFTVVCVALSAYASIAWALNTEFRATGDLSPHLRGCAIAAPYALAYIGWALFAFSDLVLLLLTAIKYKEHFRRGSPRLASSLYRHAFNYFTFSLVLSGVNLLVSLVAANHYQVLLYGIERILYTTLASRIIVRLRQADKAEAMTLDLVSTNVMLNFQIA
ncbi:hypothetical protein AURDEDRAFT_166701 [Auricularia subglabra TFB-10046 SS5]|nr:hypothetical protein AURDEDRAFT_166701 [Auricularia subglabra TFB-10046 SS5]